MTENIEYYIALAKREILEQKLIELPNDDDIYQLAKQMKSNMITAEDYVKLGLTCPSKLKRYLTSEIFLLLRKENFEIDREDILRYIQRAIDVESAILHLISYSNEYSNGYVNEKELERYIFDSIPDLVGCKNLPEVFYPFYVFTSARRFFFFLDSRRSRKLHIHTLAHSNIMEELLFIKRLSQYEKDLDEVTLASHIGTNWFSGNNASAIYSTYIELDKDRNGMLNQMELLGLNTCGAPSVPCQLTTAAINRIFDEYITYTPKEMDYKTFLDLVLALENKSNSQSLIYFWRVLDIEKSGRLSRSVIEYFYKDIYTCLRSLGYEAPTLEDIIIEINDIVSCDHPVGPSFDDLVRSNQGHTIVTMLLDVHGFWAYDNRETLIQQQQQQQEQDEIERQQQALQMEGALDSEVCIDIDDELGTSQPHEAHIRSATPSPDSRMEEPLIVEEDAVVKEEVSSDRLPAVQEDDHLYDDDYFS